MIGVTAQIPVRSDEASVLPADSTRGGEPSSPPLVLGPTLPCEPEAMWPRRPCGEASVPSGKTPR